MKKGQVTLFIIISILLVIGVVIYFLFSKGFISLNLDRSNPQKYIIQCMEDNFKEAELSALENNGLEDYSNYILYNNGGKSEGVPYLCTVHQFYFPCTPQEPMLLREVANSIEDYVEVKTKSCFSESIANLEKEGYSVSFEDGNFSLNLERNMAKISLDSSISYSKGEISGTFSGFETQINTPLFNLFSLAQVIVNYESSFCEFDDINWMRNYLDITINRFRASDQTKIYTLKDRLTEKEIKFAVKTCALPAGI